VLKVLELHDGVVLNNVIQGDGDYGMKSDFQNINQAFGTRTAYKSSGSQNFETSMGEIKPSLHRF
jgi:hypothetical protein